MLVGRYLIKMHPGVLLGVWAGAGTSAPGLAAVREVAKSKIPTLGYGVTYAVGNVMLALLGLGDGRPDALTRDGTKVQYRAPLRPC